MLLVQVMFFIVSLHQIKYLNDSMLFYSEGTNSEPFITPVGFQFLLLDSSSQIWFFMLQYLETVEVRLVQLPQGCSRKRYLAL